MSNTLPYYTPILNVHFVQLVLTVIHVLRNS